MMGLMIASARFLLLAPSNRSVLTPDYSQDSYELLTKLHTMPVTIGNVENLTKSPQLRIRHGHDETTLENRWRQIPHPHS